MLWVARPAQTTPLSLRSSEAFSFPRSVASTRLGQTISHSTTACQWPSISTVSTPPKGRALSVVRLAQRRYAIVRRALTIRAIDAAMRHENTLAFAFRQLHRCHYHLPEPVHCHYSS